MSFANLVEAHTIAAVRRSGISMQRLRPAIIYITDHLPVEHALASERFLSDGAELFFRAAGPALAEAVPLADLGTACLSGSCQRSVVP